MRNTLRTEYGVNTNEKSGKGYRHCTCVAAMKLEKLEETQEKEGKLDYFDSTTSSLLNFVGDD